MFRCYRRDFVTASLGPAERPRTVWEMPQTAAIGRRPPEEPEPGKDDEEPPKSEPGKDDDSSEANGD